jgi:hypothetical protein
MRANKDITMLPMEERGKIVDILKDMGFNIDMYTHVGRDYLEISL